MPDGPGDLHLTVKKNSWKEAVSGDIDGLIRTAISWRDWNIANHLLVGKLYPGIAIPCPFLCQDEHPETNGEKPLDSIGLAEQQLPPTPNLRVSSHGTSGL